MNKLSPKKKSQQLGYTMLELLIVILVFAGICTSLAGLIWHYGASVSNSRDLATSVEIMKKAAIRNYYQKIVNAQDADAPIYHAWNPNLGHEFQTARDGWLPRSHGYGTCIRSFQKTLTEQKIALRKLKFANNMCRNILPVDPTTQPILYALQVSRTKRCLKRLNRFDTSYAPYQQDDGQMHNKAQPTFSLGDGAPCVNIMSNPDLTTQDNPLTTNSRNPAAGQVLQFENIFALSGIAAYNLSAEGKAECERQYGAGTDNAAMFCSQPALMDLNNLDLGSLSPQDYVNAMRSYVHGKQISHFTENNNNPKYTMRIPIGSGLKGAIFYSIQYNHICPTGQNNQGRNNHAYNRQDGSYKPCKFAVHVILPKHTTLNLAMLHPDQVGTTSNPAVYDNATTVPPLNYIDLVWKDIPTNIDYTDPANQQIKAIQQVDTHGYFHLHHDLGPGCQNFHVLSRLGQRLQPSAPNATVNGSGVLCYWHNHSDSRCTDGMACTPHGDNSHLYFNFNQIPGINQTSQPMATGIEGIYAAANRCVQTLDHDYQVISRFTPIAVYKNNLYQKIQQDLKTTCRFIA